VAVAALVLRDHLAQATVGAGQERRAPSPVLKLSTQLVAQAFRVLLHRHQESAVLVTRTGLTQQMVATAPEVAAVRPVVLKAARVSSSCAMSSPMPPRVFR